MKQLWPPKRMEPKRFKEISNNVKIIEYEDHVLEMLEELCQHIQYQDNIIREHVGVVEVKTMPKE